MRFHHSTRRGRNRQSSHATGGRVGGPSKWSQLSFCRETNIHFNRRVPVEPPATAGKLVDAPDALLLSEHENEDALREVSSSSSKLLCSPQVEEALRRLQLAPSEREAARKKYQEHIYQSKSAPATSVSQTQQHSSSQQQHSQLHPDMRDVTSSTRRLGNETVLSTEPDKLDMEIAREKLLDQVKKHTFWSSKAARRMHLTGTECRRVYIYELISWCERRELEWRYQPYRGGLSAGLPTAAATPPSPLLAAGRARADGVVLIPRPPNERTGMGGTAAHLQSEKPSSELVWSLEAPENLKGAEPFSGYVVSLELPESSFVKRCHACQGRGRLKCSSCHGVGYEVCISCSGKGTTRGGACSAHRSGLGRSSSRTNPASGGGDDDDSDPRVSGGREVSGRAEEPGGICSSSGGERGLWGMSESCHFCHGAGQKRCWVCSGRAYNCCATCQGATQLRCYLSLTITWLNHRDEVILNNSDEIIKRDRLRLCSGLALVQQDAPRLRPLCPIAPSQPRRAQHPPKVGATHRVGFDKLDESEDPEVSAQVGQVSRKLLERHHEQYGARERILRQRQQLTQYECHIVRYEWKDRRGHFVVYGNERKVYIAKYPFKSLCSIT